MDEFEAYCKKNGLTGKKKEDMLEKLKKLLEKYQYEPGEAIGVVAAQSISEPATQMCTDYDEKVVIKFKDKINVVTIGEFVDWSVQKKCDKENGYEIFDVPEGADLFALSFDKNKKVKWKRIAALCRHESPAYLLEVKTQSGRSIRATDYHSFVIKSGDNVIPVSGKDLKIGDKVPVIKSLPKLFNYQNETVKSGGQLLKIRLGGSLSEIENNLGEFFWDDIVEINKIKPSSAYVYDMTVDDTHTFATLDGIIVHNTMRSYTLASQSDRLSKVTQGLPRLIEIFDARKTFEKNMIVYLKSQYNDKNKAKECAAKIKESKISDIIVSDSIDLVNMSIELELEDESRREEVKKKIEKNSKKVDIQARGKKIIITPKTDDVKNLRKLKNKIMKLHVDGVKGVENVVVVREDNDWIIQTTGSNMKKILGLDFVDVIRTRTNDSYQVREVLGVEAARNAILREAKETLEEQGLDVDIRHLMLLADMMTFSGEIRDIGRYGVAGKKMSVLARANFEETKKHLINASFYGEQDILEGIIENVIVGQIAPVGTGMVKLTVDIEKMKKGVKK